MKHFGINTLKFEPLVNLSNSKIWGYEVLSTLSVDVHPELWFFSICPRTQITLLMKQMKVVHDMSLLHKCFFNLQVQGFMALTDQDIKSISKHKSFSIEISDFGNLLRLKKSEILTFFYKISLLRVSGIDIWIDDLTTENLKMLPYLAGRIDGVKIDRSELRQGQLDIIMSEITKYLSDIPVLVEGVESHSDIKSALNSNICHAQGYFWKSKNFYHNVA